MLTLILRGCNTMLPQPSGMYRLLAALSPSAPDLPRIPRERPQFLSPRVVAALARHRRP